MQHRRKDEQTSRAIVAAFAALGTLAGFALGNLLSIPLAEFQLKGYLTRVAAQEAASVQEAHDLLAVLQHSTYPACSDAELNRFRELVFRSEYLKDAGRIRNGAIDCSATAGRPPHAIGKFKAASTAADGTIAYASLIPIRDESLKRSGFQLGTGFVVLGSHLPVVEGSLPIHLTVNPAPDAVPASDEVVHSGGTLSATHCSSTLPNCVTAAVTVDEARQGELFASALLCGLGCIVGIFAGLLLSGFWRRHFSMEQQLRRSIEKEELQVFYQPIVNLVDGKIVGAEALARWKDRNGTPVSPDLFIKIAEQHGFIGSLTSLVFRRALKDFREVLTKLPDFRLDINVTAADLGDPAFLPMLDAAIDGNKVPASSVVIEVTESSTVNQEVAMESLRLLRRRGHSIYIDDFGTGYSSLSYLTYLSVDKIKIDKSFIRAIGTNGPALAIVPPIMAMARSLNLGVVVEGVETEQQALYFTVNDQTVLGQGFLYGEGMPASEFLALLAPKLARATAQAEVEVERSFSHVALGTASVA